MNIRKIVCMLAIFAFPSFLMAAEPEGGTLIQMSSIGVVTLLLALLTFHSKSDSKILEAFSISHKVKK